MRWISSRLVNPLSRGLVVIRPGVENIVNEFLRVAIVKRKPGTLDLHHYPVAFLEHVIICVQIDQVFVYFVRDNRGRFFKTAQVSAAKDLIDDH